MKPLTVLLFLILLTSSARSQSAPSAAVTTIPVGVRLIGVRANSPPGTCGCFWLTGAAADTAIALPGRFQAAVEVAGSTASHVPSSSRGLSTITLMAGPQYTLPLRHFDAQARALFGAARGFDANFTTGTAKSDTATSFAMSLSAAIELPVTHSIAVRPIHIEYLQTNLPNGVDNRQRNLRVGAGIVFRIAISSTRR